MTDLLELASPAVSIFLGTLGIASLLFATWVNAVDIALSRMSLAYAEDLEEEGRKGARELASALKTRREDSLALLVPRGSAQALGVMALSIMLVTQFAERDFPWYANLLATGAIMALVVTGTMTLLAAMLSGDRYVWVALRGAPLANRLLRRTSAIAVWGRGADRRPENHSTRLAVVEELRELVDEVSEGEPTDLDEEDREIIRSVFELGQTRVGEVMVPRGEMVTIHGDETADDAIKLFLRSGFSRIPVIGKNSDDVLGVLYFKDVVRRVNGSEGEAAPHVSDMMRSAAFVPEMKLADDELRVMQETNSHLAMVVDEYGGIAGLITVEDILEELVGELTDEHDHSSRAPEQVDELTWEVPASYPLDDLCELLDAKIDEEDVNSVGGLLGKALGKVPLPGSSAQIGGLVLRAGDDVGRRRQINTVIATVVPRTDEEDEDE